MGKIYIGTSGFSYRHWENGVFYPSDLARARELEYYCQHFKTVELNNTFYRLPKKEAFLGWRKRTPEGFLFAVKVSRFITHIKRLKDCQDAWKTFLERVLALKEKLGALLFQLPPSLKKDVELLKNFLSMILKNSPQGLRYAFEFRHSSWCQKEIYEILKEKGCAWVIADSPSWPKEEKITAPFVYIRMHGSKSLFSSDYSKEELLDLAKKIKKWKKSHDVFCYFNNDAQGFAVKNAKELIGFLNQ